MIIEAVFSGNPSLEIEGYEKLEFPGGAVFASIADRRIELVVKQHPDGRTSIFTDRIEILKDLANKARIIDIHVK